MMSVNHFGVTSRNSERCTLGSCDNATRTERNSINATESIENKIIQEKNYEKPCKLNVDSSPLDATKSDLATKNLSKFEREDRKKSGSTSTLSNYVVVVNCNEKTEAQCCTAKQTEKSRRYWFKCHTPSTVNACDSSTRTESAVLEPPKPQLVDSHDNISQLEAVSSCDRDGHRSNKAANQVRPSLISDERFTLNSTSQSLPFTNTVNDPVCAHRRSATGSTSIVKPRPLYYRTSDVVRRTDPASLSRSSSRGESSSVTDENYFCVSTKSSSFTKPTDQNLGELSFFDEAEKMGNIPPRRSETVKNTKEEVRNKHLVTTPSANAERKVDSGTEEGKLKAHTIPEVIISDVSMEQGRKTLSLKDAGKETINNMIDANELVRDTNTLRGGDSAYSSDSRCTSMDSGNYCSLRAEDGYFADNASQLSSLTLSQEPKRFGSSSSSSSSPSHVSSTSNLSSDQTLRVISDYGMQRKLSSSSGSSFRSSLSFESEDDMMNTDNEVQRKAQSSWTKIRRMVIWSPFMQSFKKKYPWVQLAGHAGNFKPGDEGSILKKYCQREAECLSQLSRDEHLGLYAPVYHGVVDKEGERYTMMQDLLLAFDCPSVMDCKMGVRTYLEDELVKAKIKPRLRHDMYKKMTEISPDEPTAEEHEQKAVTKPRYMQWREHVSSSSNLGFRIEGIKKGDKEPSKDYKLTKTKEQVKNAFKYFINDKLEVLEKYIARLKDIRDAAEKSDFFMSHEVIGSSLLFVHDQTGHASSWMIDFGKTTKLTGDERLTHRKSWVEGNREDGYLLGLDNLISIFEEICTELKEQPTAQPNESATTITSNATDDSASASWTLSSQYSGESNELDPLDSPSLTVSDSSYDYTATPQKPQLKRQVAHSESKEDAAENGSSNCEDDRQTYLRDNYNNDTESQGKT